jgi:hypothetical protein
MRLTNLGTPVSHTDRDNGQLGGDDGTTDGGGNFGRALNSESDVAATVTDNNEGLEARTLTGTGLLLDGHNLHDVVLESTGVLLALGGSLTGLGGNELINDLVLLDGDRELEDLFKTGNLALLNETSELGDGLPFLITSTATTSTATSASATTAASTITASAITATTLASASTSPETPTFPRA